MWGCETEENTLGIVSNNPSVFQTHMSVSIDECRDIYIQLDICLYILIYTYIGMSDVIACIESGYRGDMLFMDGDGAFKNGS